MMLKKWLTYRSVLLKGLQWSFFSTVFSSLSGILYFAIVSRYLEATDFGIFSISLIFLSFIDFFSGAGLSAVIIQDKKINHVQYSTFFWLNLFIGFFWAICLYSMASWLAEEFDNTHVKVVTQLLSVAALLQSFSLLHNNILRKEILVSKLEKIEMAGSLIQTVTGIFLAVNGYAFLSLPLAFVASKLWIALANIWVGWSYFRPSPEFALSAIKPQLSLGSYQVLEKIFNYIRANADKFFIGKFLGAESLGWYSLAQKIVDLPLSKINPGLNKILFPYFSKLQHRPVAIANIYSKVTTLIIYLVVPFLLLVCIYTPQVVSLLFGDGYEPVVDVLRLLSMLGLLRSFSNIGGNILNALGKFRVGFVWNFWWALSLVLVLFAGVTYGVTLTEITLIILLANLLSFLAWHTIIYRFITLPYQKLASTFGMTCLLSMCILVPAIVINQWVTSPNTSYFFFFLFLAMISGLVFWLVKPYMHYIQSKSLKN